MIRFSLTGPYVPRMGARTIPLEQTKKEQNRKKSVKSRKKVDTGKRASRGPADLVILSG